MIIEISVAAIAVAVVVLVLCFIVLTKSLQMTLGQVNQMIVEARKQLDILGDEAKKAVEQTSQVGADLKRKMESLDSLFNSIANVGEVLEHKTKVFKHNSTHSFLQDEAHTPIPAVSHKERGSKAHEVVNVADVLELAGLGIRLWQKLKKRR